MRLFGKRSFRQQHRSGRLYHVDLSMIWSTVLYARFFDEGGKEELSQRTAALLNKGPASQIVMGMESDEVFPETIRISGSM